MGLTHGRTGHSGGTCKHHLSPQSINRILTRRLRPRGLVLVLVIGASIRVDVGGMIIFRGCVEFETFLVAYVKFQLADAFAFGRRCRKTSSRCLTSVDVGKIQEIRICDTSRHG